MNQFSKLIIILLISSYTSTLCTHCKFIRMSPLLFGRGTTKISKATLISVSFFFCFAFLCALRAFRAPAKCLHNRTGKQHLCSHSYASKDEWSAGYMLMNVHNNQQFFVSRNCKTKRAKTISCAIRVKSSWMAKGQCFAFGQRKKRKNENYECPLNSICLWHWNIFENENNITQLFNLLGCHEFAHFNVLKKEYPVWKVVLTFIFVAGIHLCFLYSHPSTQMSEVKILHNACATKLYYAIYVPNLLKSPQKNFINMNLKFHNRPR